MDVIINPSNQALDDVLKRNAEVDSPELTRIVGDIIEEVRSSGDAALRAITRRIDLTDLDTLAIPAGQLEAAWLTVPASLRSAIDHAISNITAFHRAQLTPPIVVETDLGVQCVQRQVPIDKVGLYVPGGRAPLFSTVLMLAVPAKIAGCNEIVLCTPPRRDGSVAPEILAAAWRSGVTKIFRVGGAQAIAAMALGTESIPRVSKIFGPGNRFVTKAKQMLSTITAIDMPAGPSEVMVMADDTAVAEYVAADLLSQAEHGPDSQAILLCLSEAFASEVAVQVDRLRTLLTRADCIDSSLSKSHIIVVPDVDRMIECANLYAPEHLIISMADADTVASRITAAGSVFLGNFSPESAGDYASGTNHTLPTGGWAASMSGVNIDSFMRRITFQTISQEGIRRLAPTIIAMADAEGLDAHALAVKLRIK